MWRSAKKTSGNHREVIQTICNAMIQDMGTGKEHALAVRKDMLHMRLLDVDVQWYP